MRAERIGTDKLTFLERNFEIHGELEGTVYRTKRNGEQEKYAYEPVSVYKRTPLTIRNEWIRKFACRVTNPNNADYSEIVKKLYYYTPYLVPAGEWEFMGETVLYIRERGEYVLRWQGSPLGEKRILGKRTKVKYSFYEEGSFVLDCLQDGELYCRREFIVTGEDLDVSYEIWLSENIEEILEEPEPEYSNLKIYRRGLQSKRNWIESVDGKCHHEVIYQLPIQKNSEHARERPHLYHRKSYNHKDNAQTLEFNKKMKEIGANWQLLDEEERQKWNMKAKNIWQNEGRKMKHPAISGFNLYTRNFIDCDG